MSEEESLRDLSLSVIVTRAIRAGYETLILQEEAENHDGTKARSSEGALSAGLALVLDVG
jgi:hypothetical protein